MASQVKKKNWNILVPYFGDELSDVALQEAISLCKVFNSGLVLFRDNSSTTNKSQLAAISKNIEQLHGLKVSIYAPEGKNHNFIFYLAKKTESILIVVGHNRKRTSLGKNISATLRYMRMSRTPFIMVPQAIHLKSFNDISFVMGYQKQEKEKILWASYFGRIYKSKIHVITPKANDQYFKVGIKGNLSVLDKLYNNAEVNYTNVPLPYNIYKIHDEALIYSKNVQAGIFITLTTLHPDIFDFFEGTIEKKLICNSLNIPILCINPRDDLYVLCN